MNTHILVAAAVAAGVSGLASAQAALAAPTQSPSQNAALSYRSAFADYKPWQDVTPGDWRAVNDTVRDAAARPPTPGDPGAAPAGSVEVPPARTHAPHHPAGGHR